MSVIFIQEAHEAAHNSGRRPFPQIRIDIPVKKQKCFFRIFPKCSLYPDQNP